MNNCGIDCPIRQSKGCMFSSKSEPNYKTDTETPFFEYNDPSFLIDGCPVELAMKYPHIWNFCIDMVNSKTFFLPDMPFIQVSVYNAFITDRNVVIEAKNNAGGK